MAENGEIIFDKIRIFRLGGYPVVLSSARGHDACTVFLKYYFLPCIYWHLAVASEDDIDLLR